MITEFIKNLLIKNVAEKRPPDFIIGDPKDPYMLRWWVIPRNKWFNIYLHKFLHSDDDRAEHSHPWISLSYLLDNPYTEWMKGIPYIRKAGSIIFRWTGNIFHRIELHNGPCWTLFITGPRYKEWHFACPHGLVHWKDFTRADQPGEVGPGCDG